MGLRIVSLHERRRRMFNLLWGIKVGYHNLMIKYYVLKGDKIGIAKHNKKILEMGLTYIDQYITPIGKET